jgi:uncharacterized repeat protein (TIGR02543 family)
MEGNMNKQIKGLFFVFTILASLGLLSACNQDEEIQVSSITINQDTVLDSYEVGTFDLTSVELIIRFSDGSAETIDLDPSMIEENDLVKLSTAGTHEITINHLGQTITFTVDIRDPEPDSAFLLIYELGVEAGLIEMTYEEWLESIRGEDGREVTFRVSEGFIQWQYVGDTGWTDLVALSVLVGPAGKSAYDLYLDHHPEYLGSEEQWLDDLVNGRLATSDQTTYTVTFDSNGGSSIGSQLVPEGHKALMPDNPVKEGYTFDGWYLDDVPWVFVGYPVTGDMTLHATWKVNRYTITFETDGGSLIEPVTQDYETAITVSDPVKEGHTFIGWNPELPDRMPAKDMTVTAEWQINQYTITFESNEGTAVAPITGLFGETIFYPEDPTKDRLIFDGWYKDIDLNERFEETMFPAGDCVLYAKWAPDPTMTDDMLLMPLVYDMMDNPTAYGFDDAAVDEIVVYGMILEMSQPTLVDDSMMFTSVFSGGVAIIVDDDQGVSIHQRDLDVVYLWHDLADYGIDSDGAVASRDELDAHISEYMDMREEDREYISSEFPDYKSLVLVNRTLDPSYNQAFAIETAETDNFTYAVSDYYDTARLVGVQGFGVEVDTFILEDSVQGYPVESIKPGVFNAFDSVRAIVLPSHLTFIGSQAFSGLDLESITIPEGVTSIGEDAFYGNNLTSVTLPSTLTSIGDRAFSWNNLTSVTLPSTLTSIGDSAFSYNGLSSVTLPSTLTSIGDRAFDGNSLTSFSIGNNENFAYENNLLMTSDKKTVIAGVGTLTSVTIPEGVTSIGDRAFSWNNLTSVTLPSTLTSIGDRAFDGNSLTSVIIPEGVTSIGDSAFSYNGLTSVTLPSTLTSIGDGAFYENDLTSVTLPSTLTSIGDRAFYSNNLTSVTLPSTLTSIGDRAFYWAEITNFSIENNEYFTYENNLLMTSDKKTVIAGVGTLTSVTIPEGVTSIGDRAFYNNDLTSVTIPEGVRSIGDSAFYGNNLTSVTIPEGVTSIGDLAFYNNDLTSVTIPEGVRSIGDSAFYGNNLTSVTLPSTLTSIGDRAFYWAEITNFSIENNEYFTYENNLLMTSDKKTVIAGVGTLTSVTIPEGVTSIGDWAFSWNNLTSVTLPSTLTSIGDWAFDGNSLTSITIPEGVTSIGDWAFSWNNLTSVTLPSTLTSIGDGAFYENDLTSVTLPSTLTSIGASAFWNNSLTSITIFGDEDRFNDIWDRIGFPSDLKPE